MQERVSRFTPASMRVRRGGASVRLLLLAAALLSNCTLVAAQGTSSQITGRVVDASGATITGGKVTVTNQDTQIGAATQTNSEGLYAIPQLAPGRYKIMISKEGFASAARSDVTLVVDQTAQLNFTLAAGSVSEVVQVTGDPPLLATSDPTSGEVIGEQQVASLPLNGRSPYRLVLLTPGIHSVPSTNGQFGDIPVNTTDDTLISINGGPASANEVLIDGIPTTSGFINQLTTIPSVDATQEFDVQSGPLKAASGRSGGGVINVYTKSGTNTLHGVIYEFLRNSAFDSRKALRRCLIS